MSPMDDAQPIESQVSATGTPPLSQAELDVLTDKLIEQLKSVYDPATVAEAGHDLWRL